MRFVSLPDEVQLSRFAVTLHVFYVKLRGKFGIKKLITNIYLLNRNYKLFIYLNKKDIQHLIKLISLFSNLLHSLNLNVLQLTYVTFKI